MLSFYEMNCLLEKQKSLNETGIEDLKARMAALKNKKPVQVEPPTPATQPAAPVQQTPPAQEPKKLSLGVLSKLGKNPSPNEPGTDDYNDRFRGRTNDITRPGIKPGSSKAQMNTAAQTQSAEKVARDADKIMMYNNFLASPSYQGLTAMAIQDLKLPYKVPEGRFEIAIKASRGTQAKFEEIIMPPEHALAIMKKVQSYVSTGDGRNPALTAGVELRKFLVANWDNPGLQPIILRSMQFERNILNPEVTNKVTTIGKLAEILASKSEKAGEGFAPTAGEATTKPVDDVQALSYLIKIATQKGFGHFFDIQGDPSNPDTKIRIKSAAEASQVVGGKTMGGQRYADPKEIRAKFKDAPIEPIGRPSNESIDSTDWLDMMTALDSI